jgi:CopG family transcriptional regulator / antitoxin EndoAI
MQQRINITLSDETLRLVDRVAKKGDRSGFIERAVQHYMDTFGRANLRKLMKERAIRHAARDREIAAEWWPIDQETWERLPE